MTLLHDLAVAAGALLALLVGLHAYAAWSIRKIDRANFEIQEGPQQRTGPLHSPGSARNFPLSLDQTGRERP